MLRFLALFLLCASVPSVRSDELRLAPEPGLVLEKAVEMTLEVALEDMSMTIDGEELEVELPVFRMAQTDRLECTDTYEAVEDGHVVALERVFEELSRREETEDQEGGSEEDRESPLEGATVRFDWDAEDEEYVTTEVDGVTDPEVLAGLACDLHFGEFLSGEEVEEGDEWTLDSDIADEILTLGGDLKFSGDDEEDADSFQPAMEDIDADITCRWEGIREVEEREIGVIALEFRGSGESEEEEEGGRTEFEFEMSLDGELLWDLQGGHPVSFDLSGEVAVEGRIEATLEFDEQTMEQVVQMEFRGQMQLQVSIEQP